MKQPVMRVYERMATGSGRQFAVLVDPDKLDGNGCGRVAKLCNSAGVDFIFAGGSLVVNPRMDEMISRLKTETDIPVVIFPGNALQICSKADAILLLSLISGRNAEMLIGRQVEAAPVLKKSGLEIIPTGYMLVESSRLTTAVYMSNSLPVPRNKPDVAACTALAGQMLGLRTIYLDAGSGAESPVSPEMISAVKQNIDIPLIVGGGIRTPEDAIISCKAGADIIVVGNAAEKNPAIIAQLSQAVHTL